MFGWKHLSSWRVMCEESGNQVTLQICGDTLAHTENTASQFHFAAAREVLRREKPRRRLVTCRGRRVELTDMCLAPVRRISCPASSIWKKSSCQVHEVRDCRLQKRSPDMHKWHCATAICCVKYPISPPLGQHKPSACHYFNRLSLLKQLQHSCIIPLMIANRVKILPFLFNMDSFEDFAAECMPPLCQDLGHISYSICA